MVESILLRVIAWFYWLCSRTWRIQWVNPPKVDRPHLYAHWHGDELVLVALFAFRKLGVLASVSRDGQRMQTLLRALGYRVVKGSSHRRGAAGLVGLISLVRREQRDISLAVDGPRGPRFRVKPGILTLAQQLGVPIVPGAAACAHSYVFKRAWNQCFIPLPFSRNVVVYGEPIQVEKGASDKAIEKVRQQLESSLCELKTRAEQLVGHGEPILTGHQLPVP